MKGENIMTNNYFRLRFIRGFSIKTLGPVESRVLYDSFISIFGLFITFTYSLVFYNYVPSIWLGILPVLFILINTLIGIYGRFKSYKSRIKSALLIFSILLSCTFAALLLNDFKNTVFWGIITFNPIVLARLFLGLPYNRHRNIASTVVKQRGPILVIGGAGYIGSHLVSLLLKESNSVRVLDNLMYGKDSLKEFENNASFELIEGDATDIMKLTYAMKNCSAVVQLAGLVGDPACAVDPDFTRHTNIISTRMAKDVAYAMGIYRFVFASSCSVYGMNDKEVKESDALNPVSLYAQTKVDSEVELLSIVRDDFFVTILRFATVFGHSRRPRFDLVGNFFTAQAMNEGLITVVGPNQWRPFVHVKDLAKAIQTVLKADTKLIQSQIFNIGNKNLNMTILQLARAVENVTKKYKYDVKISINEQDNQDKRNYMVSFDKIKSILGFEAAISMKEGIEEIAINFKNGEYQNYKDNIYSNVSITKQASASFQDPMQTQNLYAPLKKNT